MASVVVNGIVSEGPGAESVPDTKPQPELVIGLLAAPGPASELTESLVGEIADRLAGQLPGVRWRVEFVSDRLVQPPTDLSELIAAGRRMLLERGWHLAVCVTDLPLQTARRPVIAHVSATHGVAVLSMPALGPVSVRKRTAETIVRLVGHILGDLAQAEGAAERLPLAEAVIRRLRELGARTERGEHGVGFVARVITGNIWLLLGMLRANRPWRLALRLMRVLAVAFAAGVFALVTSDIWRLAHYLGPLRLVAIGLGSVAAITVTIMVSTGLWERSPHPAAREQVALFNIVTAATVGLGVAALYLALFVAMLAAALLLVPGSLLGLVLGHPAGRGRPGEPGLAGHFDRDAGRRARRGPGEQRERARGGLHLSAGYADRRRRRPAVTCGLRTQPSSGSHGCCQRGWPRSRVSASSGPQDPRG